MDIRPTCKTCNGHRSSWSCAWCVSFLSAFLEEGLDVWRPSSSLAAQQRRRGLWPSSSCVVVVAVVVVVPGTIGGCQPCGKGQGEHHGLRMCCMQTGPDRRSIPGHRPAVVGTCLMAGHCHAAAGRQLVPGHRHGAAGRWPVPWW